MANLNKKQIIDLAVKTAKTAGVPVDLFLALINQESGFNPNAISQAGAIGLTQLMPATARGLGVNPNLISENLIGGARYLKQQLDRFKGDRKKALAAYNAGPGAVEKYNGIPPYKETQNYVSSIEAQMKNYKDYADEVAKEVDKTVQSEQQRMVNNQIDALNEARKNYDFAGLDRLTQNYIQQYNNVIQGLRQTYPQATPEQIRQAGDEYMKQITGIQDFSQKNIDQLRADNARTVLVDPLVQGYDQRSLELQQQLNEANPYNQLAKNAPIQDLQPIDMNELRASQAADRFGTALSAMTDPNAARPDYTSMRMQQAQQLEQAAKYNQAVKNAQITGLPIDYFLTGRTADYNALAKLGEGRLQNYGNLNQAYVQNVVPNLNRDVTSLANQAGVNAVSMAEKARLAQQALINQNVERMKQEYELAGKGLGNVANLQNTALQGYNAQGLANTNVVPQIYNVGEGNLTSRLNTIENNQRAINEAYLRAATGNQGGQASINPITAANSATNAGVYSNNPALINIGAGTTLGALGYSPEQIQQILSQGSGQVNTGFMMPYPQFNQMPQQ